jgi:hypothetical protein
MQKKGLFDNPTEVYFRCEHDHFSCPDGHPSDANYITLSYIEWTKFVLPSLCFPFEGNGHFHVRTLEKIKTIDLSE